MQKNLLVTLPKLVNSNTSTILKSLLCTLSHPVLKLCTNMFLLCYSSLLTLFGFDCIGAKATCKRKDFVLCINKSYFLKFDWDFNQYATQKTKGWDLKTKLKALSKFLLLSMCAGN